jgi:hypothetical protein
MKKFLHLAVFTIIAFSISTLIFISCEDSSTNPDKNMEISGYVKDVNGIAINNAVVSAFLAEKLIESDSTDINGSFTLQNIPSENNDAVLLKISHPDYSAQSAKLKDFLSSKINGKVPVILSKDTCCGVVKAIVKDSASGNYIYDAEVKLRKGDQDGILKRTDSSGTVLFDSICTGNFSLRISKQNYKVVEMSFGLDSCQSKIIEVSMIKLEDCCGKLEFIIKDKITGDVIKEASVKITKAEGQFTATKYTDASGKVQFGELCMGKYFIRISKGDNYKVIEDYTKVENCELKSLEYKLEPIQNDCCGRLLVKVTDKTTGENIAGTAVKLSNGQTVIGTKNTNEDGYAVFEKICPNTYWIRVYKPNYKVVEMDGIKYTECDTINKEIKLEKIPSDSCCDNKVYIEPQDSATKQLIKNATVKLWKNGAILKTLTTGETGVTFTELCKGGYGVSIYAENYKTIEFQFEVSCSENKGFTKYMLKNLSDSCCFGKAKLIVKDEISGEVIKNASVKLWKGNQLIGTKSTEGGYALFENICKGTYQFSATADGYKGFEFNFELGCNETQILTKTMKKLESDTCCLGKAKIIIKDEATGEVIKNASIKLWKGGQLIGTKSTEGGYAMFEQICKGTYGVNITAAGYTGFEFNFEIGCNETREIVKTMKKNTDSCETAVLKILARDLSDQSPVEGAHVVIKRNGTVVAEGTTNADGGFGKENLHAPAEYQITVTKDGYEGKSFEMKFTECKTWQETAWLKKN